MDFIAELSNIFGEVRTTEQIDDAIKTVYENYETLNEAEKFEEMVNLLVMSGDSALSTNDNTDSGRNSEEGAVGFGHRQTINQNNQFTITDRTYAELENLFPNIPLDYIENFCQTANVESFEDLVELLASTDYVKRAVDYIEIWEQLKDMIPNADPIYLRNQARVLVKRPAVELDSFIQNALEKGDYPTYQDYLKKKQKLVALSIYKEPFNVDKYLEQHPNPVEEFTTINHKPSLSDNPTVEDLEIAKVFLYNHFNYLRKLDIDRVFISFDYNLIKTSHRLKSFPKAFPQPRKFIQEKEVENEALLKEIAFIKYEKLIKQTIKQQNDRYNLILAEAKKYGLLETCQSCYFNELIPEECYFCMKNCIFCKDCVKNWSYEIIGRGETRIPCAGQCDSEFSYMTLQVRLHYYNERSIKFIRVGVENFKACLGLNHHDKLQIMALDKNTFQRLCQRRQIEEIKQANIDGIETCPYCDFSMIPMEGDKIFKCGNPECMKETCRGCRHPPHIPLKCSEVEYDEDVKIRTYIENKMTEALLRECWRCLKKFYKESGCNKMTCTCGATMCYVCGKKVDDYNHFGTDGRCPLYTENLNEFHLNRVRTGAQLAKNELGVVENPEKLKFDPTRDLEANFNN